MFIIRPIEQKDLDGLMELLEESGHGLTTLPRDPEVLKKRIIHSERSFTQRDDRPRGEDYLFVMEELFTGKIVGVCGIISKIGGFEPSYFYRLEVHHHESKLIHQKNDITSLHFHFIHNGPAEICSLYLDPKYRNSQNGRFLSLSRFLFIAENRKFFEQEIIAEMRGMVNDSGHSPFWDAVGTKFFKIDFPKADYLYVKNKKFVEELMPKYPIIANLLPEDAQYVIGKVHPNTEPAKRILEQEGFKFSGLVGLFEPGPVIIADIDNVRTIKESIVGKITEIADKSFRSETFIISRTGGKFRATLGGVVKLKTGGLKISSVTAAALKLRLGDDIRYATFRPKEKKKSQSNVMKVDKRPDVKKKKKK
ncbi:MAG: arginine N-succinyltransferase [Bacteriovoracaceae bacterium]|nr:arginine N-succinyltransferase [Bacteriovoracaceae bacterium]